MPIGRAGCAGVFSRRLLLLARSTIASGLCNVVIPCPCCEHGSELFANGEVAVTDVLFCGFADFAAGRDECLSLVGFAAEEPATGGVGHAVLGSQGQKFQPAPFARSIKRVALHVEVAEDDKAVFSEWIHQIQFHIRPVLAGAFDDCVDSRSCFISPARIAVAFGQFMPPGEGLIKRRNGGPQRCRILPCVRSLSQVAVSGAVRRCVFLQSPIVEPCRKAVSSNTYGDIFIEELNFQIFLGSGRDDVAELYEHESGQDQRDSAVEDDPERAEAWLGLSGAHGLASWQCGTNMGCRP